jgi:hypothetical protein
MRAAPKNWIIFVKGNINTILVGIPGIPKKNVDVLIVLVKVNLL